MARVVVDPVTRIEGHLRIEAVVENGVITDAFSAGTMVRGLEKILIGRDPRDAWAITERVCGVCTTVHALTSVRSVEDALGIAVPPTAELIRNIMLTTQYVQDHVVHFYHLHALDWVDIVNALKADPKKAAELAQSFSKWDKNTPAYFTDVQNKIKAFAASGLGIFANGYWGHPAYKLPPEVNLIGVAHYLDALEWQKEIVKIHAVFGGKNPHPNYLVGGVPCSINMNEVAAINSERLNLVVAAHQPGRRVRQRGLHSRPAGRGLVLQGLGEVRRRAAQLPQLRRVPYQGLRPAGIVQVCARRRAQSRPEHRASGEPTRLAGDQGIHRALLVQLRWRRLRRACIRGAAKPRSTTPVPSRPSRRWKASTSTRS